MTDSDLPTPNHTGHHTTRATAPSWLTIGTALVAIVGLALGSMAFARSGSHAGAAAAGSFSDQQRADAKGKTCAAFDLVRRGVSRNTHLAVPGGPGDVAGNLAAAANARISLYDGGQYLHARIDPATPTELADAAKGFADTLMDIGAAATAGAMDSDPDQAARLRSADEANTAIGKLCA